MFVKPPTYTTPWCNSMVCELMCHYKSVSTSIIYWCWPVNIWMFLCKHTRTRKHTHTHIHTYIQWGFFETWRFCQRIPLEHKGWETVVLLTSNCDTLSWKTEIGRAITMNLYQSGVDPLRPTHPLSVQLVQVSQFLFDKCHLSMGKQAAWMCLFHILIKPSNCWKHFVSTYSIPCL